ncbi:hypothetical protein V5O48_004851 [Marasmius crinis-equi]|uniref:Uncharacterized protein n=1 Tax=Marasmius crinis-equi TaxID=585013 RepID=A0ABR3FP07_9AGAR
MDPQPCFVVKRKRKRRTYIDPCLGFYAPPEAESSFEGTARPKNEAQIEVLEEKDGFQRQELPEIVFLPEKQSSEPDIRPGGEDIESPKPRTEITVESFLRSHNHKKSKTKSKSKVKVKKITSKNDEQVHETDPQPRPTKRNRQRPLRDSSPPSEPVDQLFSETENVGHHITRKKGTQQKASLAQRLLQAAVLTEADPIDSLVQDVDGIVPSIPMQSLGQNCLEPSSARSKTKRRLWTLIDPRTRDENSTSCAFTPRLREQDVEQKPLTRWPTQMSVVSEDEGEEAERPYKKRKIEMKKEKLTHDESVKKVKTIRRGALKKVARECEPQAQSTLLFVPLQEAESGYVARKKKGKGGNFGTRAAASSKDRNRNPLELEAIATSTNLTGSRPLPSTTSTNAPSDPAPQTAPFLSDTAQPALPATIDEIPTSASIIASLLRSSPPQVADLHAPVSAPAYERPPKESLHHHNTGTPSAMHTQPRPTNDITTTGTLPHVSTRPPVFSPSTLTADTSSLSRNVESTPRIPTAYSHSARVSRTLPLPMFSISSPIEATTSDNSPFSRNIFTNTKQAYPVPNTPPRALDPFEPPLQTPARQAQVSRLPGSQRPLSTYFDQFFETAKNFSLSQRPATARRERQVPSSTNLDHPSTNAIPLPAHSTEAIFGPESVPEYDFDEQDYDIDVLEALGREYEVALRSSPLPEERTVEKGRQRDKRSERRPNTAVRRSMAGIRAFYDMQ